VSRHEADNGITQFSERCYNIDDWNNELTVAIFVAHKQSALVKDTVCKSMQMLCIDMAFVTLIVICQYVIYY